MVLSAAQGSVFVEFDKVEEAEKFIQMEGLKYEETELQREWK